MKDNQSEIIYYPNFSIDNLAGIKRSLLLYDRVHVIAPTFSPGMFSRARTLSADAELVEIKSWGALDFKLIVASNGGIEPIDIEETFDSYREEFINALNEDMSDPEVDAWEKRWKALRRDVTWLVVPWYFGSASKIDFSKYQIEEVQKHFLWNRSRSMNLLKVPFRIGMSLCLSEALWSAVDNGYTLFTDDLASEELLMLRMKRGWKHLTRNRELQHSLEIEPRLATNFAIAQLGIWTLEFKISEYFEKISAMELEEIIDLRERSDDKEVLKKFRSGLASIVMDRSLWNAKSFREFEEEARKAVDENIKPAFEALVKRNILSSKDLVTALDLPSTVSQAIKSGPNLFASAAIPTMGAAGALVLFSNIHLVPPVLLALGCGLGADYIAKLMSQIREKYKERQSAKFLIYPINIHKALK